MVGIPTLFAAAVLIIGLAEADRGRGFKGCQYVDRTGEAAGREPYGRGSKRFLCRIAPQEDADRPSDKSSEEPGDFVDYDSGKGRDLRGRPYRGLRRERKPQYSGDYESSEEEDVVKYRRLKSKPTRGHVVRIPVRAIREGGRYVNHDSAEDHSPESGRYHSRYRKATRGRYGKNSSRYRKNPPKELDESREEDYYGRDSSEEPGYGKRGYAGRYKYTERPVRYYEGKREDDRHSEGVRNIFRHYGHKVESNPVKLRGKYHIHKHPPAEDHHEHVEGFGQNVGLLKNNFKANDEIFGQQGASSSQSYPTEYVPRFTDSFEAHRDYLRNYYDNIHYGDSGSASSHAGYKEERPHVSSLHDYGQYSMGSYGGRYRRKEDSAENIAEQYKDSFGGNANYQYQPQQQTEYGEGTEEDGGYQLGYSLGSMYGKDSTKEALSSGYDGTTANTYNNGNQYGYAYSTLNGYGTPYSEQSPTMYGVDATDTNKYKRNPVSGVSYVIFHRDARTSADSSGNYSNVAPLGI